MSLQAKLQPVVILGAALLGLILGRYTILGGVSTLVVEIFLMLLLSTLFMNVDLKQLLGALKNTRYTMATLVINFLFTPIIAFILGNVFFLDSIEIRIGLIMLLVTPCTDWYLVFTGLSKGNVELNLSILPINLLLQIMLMPMYLQLFVGGEMQLHLIDTLQSVVFVLIIPFAFAVLTKCLIKNKEGAKEWFAVKSDDLQLLFLCVAVVMMFVSEGNSVFENPQLLFLLFCPLLLFFVLLFIVGQVVGRLLRFEKKDIIALNFTTLARNSPLALAIAVATFPEYPLISLSLVIGPLIELPILSIISSILLKWNEK